MNLKRQYLPRFIWRVLLSRAALRNVSLSWGPLNIAVVPNRKQLRDNMQLRVGPGSSLSWVRGLDLPSLSHQKELADLKRCFQHLRTSQQRSEEFWDTRKVRRNMKNKIVLLMNFNRQFGSLFMLRFLAPALNIVNREWYVPLSWPFVW